VEEGDEGRTTTQSISVDGVFHAMSIDPGTTKHNQKQNSLPHLAPICSVIKIMNTKFNKDNNTIPLNQGCLKFLTQRIPSSIKLKPFSRMYSF
jgi:hypothetical protein